MKQVFVAYVRCRLTDGTAYYVGAGRHDRAFHSRIKTNPRQLEVHRKCGTTTSVVLSHSEKEAVHDFEQLLISEYRRRGFDLVNVSSGGCGGGSGVQRSPERLAKQAESYRATMAKDPERRERKRLAVAAASKQPARCAKLSASLTGRVFSEEHRRNIALARIGRAPWNKGITKCKE